MTYQYRFSAIVLFTAVMFAAGTVFAQERAAAGPSNAASSPAPAGAQPSSAVPAAEAAAQSDDAAAQRTELNLLGEVDSNSGEARRNENNSLTLINNNVLKDLSERIGATATVTTEFDPERGYFSTELGNNPSSSMHAPVPAPSLFHGSASWGHSNSVFNARSFFQVGGVAPAHSNDYSLDATAPLWRGAHFVFSASQGKKGGQVNGNILVPAASERTPLTTDPATRKIVQEILDSYPSQLPNGSNPRALNLNAPQTIYNRAISGNLDQTVGTKDHLMMQYGLTLQKVDAFELVAGENPNTWTRNHRTQMTWDRVWQPGLTSDFTVKFTRTNSVLAVDESSPPARFTFSRELASIGPDINVPIDRAQNNFGFGGRVRQIHGNHSLTYGFSLTRRQTNGFESDGNWGSFGFNSDFGNSSVTNMLLGLANRYTVTLGNPYRGFRDWLVQFYAGDNLKVSPRLTLDLGLSYTPSPTPTEVNNLNVIPYGCDCNNLSPRFGFAYRLGDKLGVIRASYGLFYGEIYQATYMQIRFNPPGSSRLDIRNPNMANPLQGIDVANLDPNMRSTINVISPDLATPYTHQYDFSWEFAFHRGWKLDLGYVGSRSVKLIASFTNNRSAIVPGIPTTSGTVNDRRPDPRYFDVFQIVNGSRGYYDAAKVTLTMPERGGWAMDVSYWFSKAIDLGADYNNTAAGKDRYDDNQSQTEGDFVHDMKGLSVFDQPHSLLFRPRYTVPRFDAGPSWLRAVASGWSFSSVLLMKSGTPFTVQISSDAPGVGNVDGSRSDRPNLLDPSVLGRSIDNPDTSTQMLPFSAFGFILPGEARGNLGRSTFRKDGIFNMNANLSRSFPVDGDKALTFSVESLNLLNHPQFAEPGRGISTENFGQITNTLNDGRSFRFTLQFGF